ncbi:MAG: hypothetical protein ACMXYM_00700 [Candidatus Woesearchaeota archaeon]
MEFVRFTTGVLGVVLIAGAFSSLASLLVLGGPATGSVALAVLVPLLIMVFGASMVYFAFYYRRVRHSPLRAIIKWGGVYTLALLLASFFLSRIAIEDSLARILFTALIISVCVQIARNHDSPFMFRWFVFYFLIYAISIWILETYVLPAFAIQTMVFSSLAAGFALSGVVSIVRKLNVKRNSVHWLIIILLAVLIVSHLDSPHLWPIARTIDPPSAFEASENRQVCPTPQTFEPPVVSEMALNPQTVGPALNRLIDTSVWRIESDFRNCYQGRYRGQYPEKYYCDDMIVSRWETGSSGTIRYRWYVAVSAVWRPEMEDFSSRRFVFEGFSCESGKRVTVDKETTDYYVHVSRDGTQIRIQY